MLHEQCLLNQVETGSWLGFKMRCHWSLASELYAHALDPWQCASCLSDAQRCFCIGKNMVGRAGKV